MGHAASRHSGSGPETGSARSNTRPPTRARMPGGMHVRDRASHHPACGDLLAARRCGRAHGRRRTSCQLPCLLRPRPRGLHRPPAAARGPARPARPAAAPRRRTRSPPPLPPRQAPQPIDIQRAIMRQEIEQRTTSSRRSPPTSRASAQANPHFEAAKPTMALLIQHGSTPPVRAMTMQDAYDRVHLGRSRHPLDVASPRRPPPLLRSRPSRRRRVAVGPGRPGRARQTGRGGQRPRSAPSGGNGGAEASVREACARSLKPTSYGR